MFRALSLQVIDTVSNFENIFVSICKLSSLKLYINTKKSKCLCDVRLENIIVIIVCMFGCNNTQT